ncbi:MAG TPA: GlsB/YeaQ/YmgE family stress response membrane protein [Thermoanaerobaculia bacterium]|nr:GlsB/YeaQ/YmgE family stress response membrane protein [Thermoanaerobaculia bacterium]
MGLLWFLIIGAIAGWLAGLVMKGRGFGLLGDIIVGVLGAIIGGYLFSMAGVGLGGGLIGSLVVAFLGAVVLLFAVRLFNGRRSGRGL